MHGVNVCPAFAQSALNPPPTYPELPLVTGPPALQQPLRIDGLVKRRELKRTSKSQSFHEFAIYDAWNGSGVDHHFAMWDTPKVPSSTMAQSSIK
jgi:hypothetical protein